MTDTNTLRVIPDRRWCRIWKCGKHTDVVVLVVASDKRRLPVSDVEVKLQDVGILVRWRRRIESIATGVDSVTACCVIRYITARFVSKEIKRLWINTRRHAIRCGVERIDLCGSQTAET